MVYFIEAVGAGLVKIGFTDGNPEDRLKQLQTGCPHALRLRAAMHGDLNREKAMHQQFAHLRESGEWFRLTLEVEAYIAVAVMLLPAIDDIEARVRAIEVRLADVRLAETVEGNDSLWELAGLAHALGQIARRDIVATRRQLGFTDFPPLPEVG